MSERATTDYNLAGTHPTIVKERHKTKNKNLTSKDVTSGSKKKSGGYVKNHEWEATVAGRSEGNGCSRCYNEKRNT